MSGINSNYQFVGSRDANLAVSSKTPEQTSPKFQAAVTTLAESDPPVVASDQLLNQDTFREMGKTGKSMTGQELTPDQQAACKHIGNASGGDFSALDSAGAGSTACDGLVGSGDINNFAIANTVKNQPPQENGYDSV
jgi:hypothetical protein